MRKPFAQAAKGDEEIRYLLPHLYSPTRAARALVRTLRVELEARPTSGLRQPTTVPTTQSGSQIALVSASVGDLIHQHRYLNEINFWQSAVSNVSI